jgi:hypothetical protein
MRPVDLSWRYTMDGIDPTLAPVVAPVDPPTAAECLSTPVVATDAATAVVVPADPGPAASDPTVPVVVPAAPAALPDAFVDTTSDDDDEDEDEDDDDE